MYSRRLAEYLAHNSDSSSVHWTSLKVQGIGIICYIWTGLPAYKEHNSVFTGPWCKRPSTVNGRAKLQVCVISTTFRNGYRTIVLLLTAQAWLPSHHFYSVNVPIHKALKLPKLRGLHWSVARTIWDEACGKLAMMDGTWCVPNKCYLWLLTSSYKYPMRE